MGSSNLMARPLFSSSFCALMTGGRKAPSDGGPKITIESGSGACAMDAPVESNIPVQAKAATIFFMIFSSKPEQALRKAAIYPGALGIRKFSLLNDFQRREIADR